MAPSLLLALPPELREIIWDLVLGNTVVQTPSGKPGAYHMLNETRLRVPGITAGRSDDILKALINIGYPSILQVSKDVRREALPRYYALGTFRFDDVDALVVWLQARTVMMTGVIKVVGLIKHSVAHWSEKYAREEERWCEQLREIAVMDGVGVGKGVIRIRSDRLQGDEWRIRRSREERIDWLCEVMSCLGHSSAMANTTPSRLLALPAELREMIWDYALTGTIAQIPRQTHNSYTFRKTQLQLLWAEDRVYYSNDDRLQAIKEQGHPAILRLSKQIRHEALPRYYIFSVFRFDTKAALMRWLSARPARVRKSITSVQFVLRYRDLGAEFTVRREASKFAALEAELTAEGLALRKGVLEVRVNES
ncbi:hypothetical protein LTR27_002819 [Elasticomyces elasticus]|nr:hypothetical protein LTR27_002819 [Elasticomyces elasticus]